MSNTGRLCMKCNPPTSKNSIKKPFCIVDGVRYQLYRDEYGMIRFPHDGRPKEDLNQMMIDYANRKTKLEEMWQYCINTGTSYGLVYDWFGTNGANNHLVTQGAEPTKKFRFYP